jgi:hypothetical protein
VSPGRKLLESWESLLEAAAVALERRAAVHLGPKWRAGLDRSSGSRALSAARRRAGVKLEEKGVYPMLEELHLVREHLFECDVLCQRLSSALSERRIPADMAPLLDGLRMSVLAGIRVAHAAELAAKLVETSSPQAT